MTIKLLFLSSRCLALSPKIEDVGLADFFMNFSRTLFSVDIKDYLGFVLASVDNF